VLDARQFISALNQEVTAHPAVNHSFLEAVSSRTFSRAAWSGFGRQLYPHVHFFIPYMEELLLNTLDMNAKLVVAKILLDEYGEDAAGDSHPELFRRFFRASQSSDDDAILLHSPLDEATVDLVKAHMRMCGEEDFLVGLGALGPAHEFAITHMFPKIVTGLQRSGFTDTEIEFFILHVEHDVEHASMLDDSIASFATTAVAQAAVRRGAMTSLETRDRLWSAMERRMIGIDEGVEPPTTETTVVDLAGGYKHVPETFWPA
jgi:pyrroloquinoline quinone (PQQ) biosynthesis protein C